MAYADQDRGGTAVISTLSGNIGAGTQKWLGGVLASNGKIYCVPYLSTDILVINPSTNSSYLIAGPAKTLGRWNSAAIGSDGKIYCPPRFSSSVSPFTAYYLVIDPSNDTWTTTTFGLATIASGQCGAVAFNGGAGIVFGTNAGINVLNVGSQTLTVRLSGSTQSDGSASQGFLAGNGKVYLPPGIRASTGSIKMRVYDPATDGFSIFQTFSNGGSFDSAGIGRGWYGGFQLGTTLYFVPVCAGGWLTYDYATGNQTVHDGDYSDGIGWVAGASTRDHHCDGVQLPDGRFYAAPATSEGWQIVTRKASQSRFLPPGLDIIMSDFQQDCRAPNKWAGCVQAPDGRIFSIPWNADHVMIVTPGPFVAAPPPPPDPMPAPTDSAIYVGHDTQPLPYNDYGDGLDAGSVPIGPDGWETWFPASPAKPRVAGWSVGTIGSMFKGPDGNAPPGPDLSNLPAVAPLLWDTRVWDGTVGYRKMPNLGTAGDVFDLPVEVTNNANGQFFYAYKGWNEGVPLTWEDFGGHPHAAPWTWCVVVNGPLNRQGMYGEAHVDVGRGTSSGPELFSYMYEATWDGTNAGIEFYMFTQSHLGTDRNFYHDDSVLADKLIIITEQFVPVLNPADGRDPEPGGPSFRYLDVNYGVEQVYPFNASFLGLGEHNATQLGIPGPGEGWSPYLGAFLVRGRPTLAERQAWHNYWFPA